MVKRFTPDQKSQVLARLARGDQQQEIAKDVGFSENAITELKNNNLELLGQMQTQVDDYRARQATKILNLSQKRILNRLEDEERANAITINELNTVSKTAYDQLRLEQGKATSISSTAPLSAAEATKENLQALMDAINAGDEVKLQQVVFRKQ